MTILISLWKIPYLYPFSPSIFFLFIYRYPLFWIFWVLILILLQTLQSFLRFTLCLYSHRKSCYSKHGPQTTSSIIFWKFVRVAESQAPFQTYQTLTKWSLLKFEKKWQKFLIFSTVRYYNIFLYDSFTNFSYPQQVLGIFFSLATLTPQVILPNLVTLYAKYELMKPKFLNPTLSSQLQTFCPTTYWISLLR